MESKAKASLFFLLTIFSCVFISSQAYDFLVGGRDGWVVRPSESYDSWAQRMRFQVNDTLVFRYQNGTDSVLAVNRQDYDTCNTANPILRLDGGNSRYMLERSGPFYFITGNQANCLAGQKLVLIVMSPRSPPTPIPTPATPPGTAPPPQALPPTPSGAVPPTPTPGSAPPTPGGAAPTPGATPPSGGVAPTPSGTPPSGGVAPTPGGGAGGPSGSEGPSGAGGAGGPSGGGGGGGDGGGAGDEVPTPNTPPSSSPALLSSMGLSVLVIMVLGCLIGNF